MELRSSLGKILGIVVGDSPQIAQLCPCGGRVISSYQRSAHLLDASDSFAFQHCRLAIADRKPTVARLANEIMGDSHSDNSLHSRDLNMITDSADSDINLQSGDPDKYWWIGGDDPYWSPPERTLAEGQPSGVEGDDAPTTDGVSSEVNPRILELEELTREMDGHTRYLEVHVQQLQHDAQVREAELTRVSTVNHQLLERDEHREAERTCVSSFNDQLAERVASLCTYICSKWASDAAGDARVMRLTLSLRLCIAMIIALLAIVIALLAR